MESVLKERCDAAADGDYTLWTTGPEAALEMLRVSYQGRCPVNVLLSSEESNNGFLRACAPLQFDEYVYEDDICVFFVLMAMRNPTLSSPLARLLPSFRDIFPSS